MSDINFKRRQFLQSALYSSLIYGAGSLPQLSSSAMAAPLSLNRKLLVNLDLRGGPDLRHLVVPAYDPSDDSFGGKYWKHRALTHHLVNTAVTAQQRYEDDYVEITVGDANWNSKGLVDVTGVNSGVKFGIWREASWLIDMMKEGNVAMVFNAVGGTNRAHDLSSMMLAQGNLLASFDDRSASGWGGRLARSMGARAISMTSSPSAFLFGPEGAAPNYDPSRIDNADLLSIENSRKLGLHDFNIESDQPYRRSDKLARAAKSYYGALRKAQIGLAYQKAMDHEVNTRQFGDSIRSLLNDENIPVPILIQALGSGVGTFNPDPNEINTLSRRVLHNKNFSTQIQNLYDIIAINNLPDLSPGVLSLSYGGWDSHKAQRLIPDVLSTDPNNPYESRGIESGLKDIFGGQFGSIPTDPSALHGGFSALWEALPNTANRSNIALTIAGEFGRQIRGNGGFGTDHGSGNLMFVIGESVRGGVYGEVFQDDEVDKYDDLSLLTPDIAPKTEIDSFFSKVCDWVVAGSGQDVFPRTKSGYLGELPLIEVPSMFDSLFS